MTPFPNRFLGGDTGAASVRATAARSTVWGEMALDFLGTAGTIGLYRRIESNGSKKFPADVTKGRKLRAPSPKAGDVQIGADDSGGGPCLGEHFARRRHHHRTPGILKVWVGADSVCRNDERLVLDGSGDQQGPPVRLPGNRPVGPDREDLRSGSGSVEDLTLHLERAKEIGERINLELEARHEVDVALKGG